MIFSDRDPDLKIAIFSALPIDEVCLSGQKKINVNSPQYVTFFIVEIFFNYKAF